MMNTSFTIRDLAQLTRIKPHTLRIWEQRYGLLKPQRTDTNIRLYTQEELKFLLNVAILYENGVKISRIASLPEQQLRDEVKKLTQGKIQYFSHIQGLVLAMLDLDEEGFNQQLTSNSMAFGMEETISKIIFPFLQHIGILWQTNTINPAQEHFITYLIRQKLIVAIDEITGERIRKDHRKIILFLPEGELHEISLLYTCYLLKKLGHKVIYLGQSLPLHDLEAVQQIHRADVLFTIITSTPCLEDVQPYLDKLAKTRGIAEVIVTGYQITSQELKLPEGLKMMKNPEEIRENFA
jgi:DNA-binding transcriptional MerR regulator